jgi:hypothetical protein
MDPTVAGALVGGGFSAAGALGTQAITAWRASQQDANALARDEAQANRTRLDYLREVLEAGAVAVHDADLTLDNTGNVITWVDQGRLKVTEGDPADELDPKGALIEPLTAFQESIGSLWRQHSRLALLVGHDHDAYVGFHAAAEAFHDALVAFDRWHKWDITGQELSAVLRKSQGDVADAEKQFFAGSRSAIGPKLP